MTDAPTLTIEHYKTHIEPLVAARSEKSCDDYWGAFRGINSADEADLEKKEILQLFDAVASYMLVPDSPNEVFKPVFTMGDRRSAIPSDLTLEQRNYLELVLPEIQDAELKARVADTLWSVKHGRAAMHAETAIAAYLISADNLAPTTWSCAFKRLERALRLYFQLGLRNKENPPEKDVPKKILETIDRVQDDDPPYFTKRLIGLLHEMRLTEYEKHSAIVEKVADFQENQKKDYHTARDAWSLAAKLHTKASQKDDAVRCQIKAAETYVKIADLAEAAEKPSYMHICSWLQSAVEAYRLIPNAQVRRDELYGRLVQAQPRIREEMQSFSTEIDVTDIAKRAREEVTDTDKFNSLQKFAFLLRPPRLDDIRKQMDDRETNAPLASMLAASFHDRKGRVVAKTSGDDPEEVKMHRHVAQYHRNFYAKAALWPAMIQIRNDHDVSLDEWISFLQDHPFVPKERILAYAHGLFHGFHGDYLSAAHVFIPQIENSIRHVLNQFARETSRQIEGGLQEESSLNFTLNCPELIEIFGENLVFDLKGLLVEKVGENLRNQLSHGLLDDDQMFSPEMVYLYWLTLFIIFLPTKQLQHEQPEVADTAEVVADA